MAKGRFSSTQLLFPLNYSSENRDKRKYGWIWDSNADRRPRQRRHSDRGCLEASIPGAGCPGAPGPLSRSEHPVDERNDRSLTRIGQRALTLVVHLNPCIACRDCHSMDPQMDQGS